MVSPKQSILWSISLPFEVEFDDGAESIVANLLPQHLILAVLLHVAILITMNYEMRTEIWK